MDTKTLRDEFAMAALSEALRQTSDIADAAEAAYRVADAMMEARVPLPRDGDFA